MAAYATPQLELASTATRRSLGGRTKSTRIVDDTSSTALLDAMLDQLADRVAERLATAMQNGAPDSGNEVGEWLDSRHAAEYLGIHRDTLRKLAAERAIPSEQDGPNCKLYFRRSDLDVCRRTGGRPRHLSTTLQRVA
jgi:excisionase family DNA binding protein